MTAAISLPRSAKTRSAAAMSLNGMTVTVCEAVLWHAQRVDGRNRRAVRTGIDRGMHADFEVVVRAVIAAFHLDDQLASCEGARAADGHHGGLGAGIGEAHLFDRLDATGQSLGEIGLGLQSGGIVGAKLHLGRDGFGDWREGVTVDERGVVVQNVDVGVSVEVGKGVSLPLDDCERVGRVKRDRAGIAPGHRVSGALVGCSGLWRCGPRIPAGFAR